MQTKDSTRQGLRNFTIAPPRIASAGHPLDLRQLGAAPEYMPEPYARADELSKALKKKAREKIFKPWGSSGRGGGLFDSLNAYNTLGTSETSRDRRPNTVPSKPFVPSAPVKKGNFAYGKLSDTNYSNWVGEPYRDPYRLFQRQTPRMGEKAFRPVGGFKTVYTPSKNPYDSDIIPPRPEIVQ